MSRGKDICKELKSIRKQIAEENGIPLEIKECTYKGPCKGTCPRCEAEVRYLENSLASRLKMGKVATVTGLALGLASCGGPVEGETNWADTMFAEDTASKADTTRPEDGPETSIMVPEVGELIVSGKVAEDSQPPKLDEAVMGGLCIIDEPEQTPLWVGEVDDSNEPKDISDVEIDPEFPGGIDAMHRFFKDNIKYPQAALDNDIRGMVYVTFVVEEDGSISNPRLLRDIGGGCGNEAIRVVKMMPKWTPGKQGGKPVRVQYNLPVGFTLPTETITPVGTIQHRNADSVKVIVK